MESNIKKVVVAIKIIKTTTKIIKSKQMNIIERMQAPTPKFFRVLRNIGLGLAAVGGVIIASPITIPTIIITIGGYLIVAGSVATAISQAVTTNEQDVLTNTSTKKNN